MKKLIEFTIALLLLILTMLVVTCSESERQSKKEADKVGKTAFISKPKFQHDKHNEEQQIACKTCHHETNAAKLKIPHQEYFKDFWIDCQICHHDKNKPQESVACSDCHKSSLTNITDETLSAKVVIHKSCGRQGCHEIGRGKDASNSCSECHKEE
jgi:Na+-transporting methylmalonyl-CoA/oxaloacetate decarboxylase gamma subunit